ncbi:hypothetical protein H206_00738 [Candidatus Electrothrix aarhusensis]|uniref:Uncharacterized protein n=1 Tax=Candidatus Electrothrix aarhusensis TaxID=1859131 RepID=A0A3S3RR33_9BACT|nr:hypothetical protein H206_00738 [Candidatus Electrothrix aarhusensis]
MSKLKSVTVKSALLLSLAACAFSANTVSAVDVPATIGNSQLASAISTVSSSPAIKNVMNGMKDQVLAEKIVSKPLINDLMPKIETEMLPIVKEKILPAKMAGLQNEMAQKIAPTFK